MRQCELKRGKLLDVYGNLIEAGYSKELVKEYDRKAITAPALRIKEWDYYYIGNSKYGVALTIADNSYMALGSVSFLDFNKKEFTTRSIMKWFTKGKTNLPSTSLTGDVAYTGKNIHLEFLNDGDKRTLKATFKEFQKIKDFSCEFELFNAPNESMVIATPFDKKHYFYYNQKINCIRAKGEARIGGNVYKFSSDDTFAVLDWGRGVWTYKNTWYWSSLNSMVDGRRIGFNLGYGFGNTSKATENMLFLDGKAYKIDEVTFHIPKNSKGKDNYLDEWRISSNDNSVNLKFTPILNRKDYTNALIIKSDQNQVFGKFSGTLVINNEIIQIKDLVGFAEKVKNCW